MKREDLSQSKPPEQAPAYGTAIPTPPEPAAAPTAAEETCQFATRDYLTPALPAAMPGEKLPTLPGYSVLGVLGRGGMGVVYKALQIDLNRLVALKMILSGPHAGPDERARFRREAEAAARLQHPHIVSIYHIDEQEGRPFLALEYVDGGSLAQRIKGQPQAPAQTAELVETLARAVHAAHQAGIVHRDLKPGNVLLSRAGSPKITDFGLAKTLEDEPGSQQHTPSGAILGTPSYMAPEQAAGKIKDIGPPADVYALGMILYEMLTGRPAFLAPSPMEVLAQVLADEPVPPTRLLPRLPRDLETICLKCLQKDPSRRYASAQDLADDLERFRTGETITARPIGAVERSVKWAKRRPALAALVMLALATILTLAGGGLWFAQYEHDQRVQADGLRLQAQGAERTAKDAEKTAKIAEKGAKESEKTAKAEKAIADQARAEEERQKKRATRLLALSLLDRGLAAAEQGEVGQALLLWTQCLKMLPQEETALDRVVRTNLNSWAQVLPRMKSMFPPDEEQECPLAAAISPDGKTVLLHGMGGRARLWDLATVKSMGAPVSRFAALFSPDGKILANVGQTNDSIQLLELTSRKAISLPSLFENRHKLVAFSPDGKSILTSPEQKVLQIWEAETGKPHGAPFKHDAAIESAGFSADGKTVLFQGTDRAWHFWDTVTGQRIATPWPPETFVSKVVLSPDNKVVLGVSSYQVYRWEKATGKELGSPLKHQGHINALVFSPDGQRVLTASADGTARVWHAVSGDALTPPLNHLGAVSLLAFSPDGTTILTGSRDRTARLWNAATGKPLSPSLAHPADLTAVAFAADGKTVITFCYDEAVRCWSPAPMPSPRLSPAHRRGVLSLVYSSDGKTILTGSADSTAQVWDAETGKLLGPSLKHDREVVAVALSPDNQVALTASDDTARLWNPKTGTAIGMPINIGNRELIRAVAFSPDGKTILLGGDDVVERWPIGGGKASSILTHQESLAASEITSSGGVVQALAISPDGQHILTGLYGAGTINLQSKNGKTILTRGATACLWRLVTGKFSNLPHQGDVKAVALSPDSRLALTGGVDHTARLWQVDSGKALLAPLRHHGNVLAVAFSPDSQTALTGSADRTARLWDVATGRPLGPPLPHTDEVRAVAYSPKGSTFLTGCADGKAGVWLAPLPLSGDPERLVRWAEVITGMEIDEHGARRMLDAKTWHEHRRALLRLGGPPVSNLDLKEGAGR